MCVRARALACKMFSQTTESLPVISESSVSADGKGSSGSGGGLSGGVVAVIVILFLLLFGLLLGGLYGCVA